MSTATMPALCVHPAEIIADELRERGWSLDDLAEQMGPYPMGSKEWQIERISLDFYMHLRQEGLLLGGMAEGLGKAFGTGAQFWTNLDNQWRDWAKANPELAKQQQDAVEDME